MEESENKGNGKLKTIVVAIVVIIIVIASVIVIKKGFEGVSTGPEIDWPWIGTNITKNNSVYTVTITDIEYNSGIGTEPAWLNFSDVKLMLMSHSPVLTDSLVEEVYYDGSATVAYKSVLVSRLELGSIEGFVNSSGPIIYYDLDNNKAISVNDVIEVDSKDLPSSDDEPLAILSFIYIGELDSLLNDDIFIPMKYIGLKNSEWWIYWTW